MQNNQAQANDLIKQVGGIVTWEVIRDGKNGPEVIDRRVSPNLIVNYGKTMMWRKVTGLNTHLWRFFRIGTCGAVAASNQTLCCIEPIAGTRKTVNSYTMSGATRTFAWVYSYPSGGGSLSVNNIREVVLCDQLTTPGGSIMMRSVITPAVNKTTHDKLRISYKSRIT